jgi:hypothetical protein
MYYTYETLPWLALIVIAAAVATTRRLDVPLARVLPAAGFCVVAAPLLLRGNLYQNTRLADFTTPAVLLAALMIASSWRAPLPRVASNAIRLLIASVSFITVMAVCSFGQSTVHAGRLTALVDEGGVHDEALRLWQGLFAVPPRLDWVPREGGVRGAVEYLRQCTGAHDRVLVFGFYPDIVFFSGRGAATDRMVLLRGFATHPDDEGRLLTAMRRHPAAVAIVGSDSGNGSAGGRVLDGVHPLLEQYLVSHYTRVATTGFGGSSGAAFDVWAMTDRRPSGTGPFDLPCFGNPTGR